MLNNWFKLDVCWYSLNQNKLVIYLIFFKNKIASLYRKLFTKLTIPQKLNNIYLFCKNELIVYTSFFFIRSYVIFSKKISGILRVKEFI